MGYNFTKQTQNETHEKADFTYSTFSKNVRENNLLKGNGSILYAAKDYADELGKKMEEADLRSSHFNEDGEKIFDRITVDYKTLEKYNKETGKSEPILGDDGKPVQIPTISVPVTYKNEEGKRVRDSLVLNLRKTDKGEDATMEISNVRCERFINLPQVDGKYPKESFATIKYADFETGLNDKGKAVAALFKDDVNIIQHRDNTKLTELAKSLSEYLKTNSPKVMVEKDEGQEEKQEVYAITDYKYGNITVNGRHNEQVVLFFRNNGDVGMEDVKFKGNGEKPEKTTFGLDNLDVVKDDSLRLLVEGFATNVPYKELVAEKEAAKAQKSEVDMSEANPFTSPKKQPEVERA